MSSKAIQTIREWLPEHKRSKVLKDTEKVTDWVFQAIKQICREDPRGSDCQSRRTVAHGVVLPSREGEVELIRDYRTKRPMFFKAPPDWAYVIETLEELEREINGLGG